MALQDLLEEERRKRGAGGGYQGIGGAATVPGMMLPFLQGLPTYDYSGPGRSEFGQSRGLGQGQGPSARHFQRMGLGPPPPFDTQNPVGGPNVAPGADNNQSVNQPNGIGIGQTGAPPPGQGGVPPGQMLQTQGWRNYAPGYAAAAQAGYGTPEFGQKYNVGGVAAGQQDRLGNFRNLNPELEKGGPYPQRGGGVGPPPVPQLGNPIAQKPPVGGPGGGPASSAVGGGPGGRGGGGRGGGGSLSAGASTGSSGIRGPNAPLPRRGNEPGPNLRGPNTPLPRRGNNPPPNVRSGASLPRRGNRSPAPAPQVNTPSEVRRPQPQQSSPPPSPSPQPRRRYRPQGGGPLR